MKDHRMFSNSIKLPAKPAARICMYLALAASLGACKQPGMQEPTNTTAQQQTSEPAPMQAQEQPSAAMQEQPAMPAQAQPEAPAQMVPVQAQASSAGGWNLRVKGIAAQSDHTILDVSVAFANQRRPQGAQLAGSNTFLLTDNGTRLLIKRPPEDNKVQIANNASMEGQLTFLGAIPMGTQQLTLVVNEGNSEDDLRAPTLQLPIPLPSQIQSQLRVHNAGANARYPVQANNEGGLLVQVQSVRREADSTRLQVSISFSNPRRPDGTELAGGETFLRTAAGDRLMLQRSADNPRLLIANNQTMVGELVFQGALPANAQGLTLVINDTYEATSIRASGLVMALPTP